MTTNRTGTQKALLRAARALTLATVLQGLTRWLALSGGALLLLVLLDICLNLPSALRLPLVWAWLGFALYDASVKVVLPLIRPISPAQAARMLEVNKKISGNLLINAFQFEKHPLSPRYEKFLAGTLASSESCLVSLRPGHLWRTASLQRWLIAILLVVVLGGATVATFPRYIQHSFSRIIMPLADIPPILNWELEVTPTGPVSLVEGDKLDITVHVIPLGNGSITPPVPELIWKTGTADLEPNHDEGEHADMIPSSAANNFTYSFESVTQSFSFRVWEENGYSSAVMVKVIPLPRIKSAAFSVTPPAYTGLKPYLQPGPPTDLQVPVGSTVTTNLELEPDSTALTWKEKELQQQMHHAGSNWTIDLPTNASWFYSLFTAIPEQTDPRLLCQGQITAQADRPPEVEFVADERNILVNPGGTLPLTIRATDDYGVAGIGLFISPGNDPANTRLLKSWEYVGPPGEKEPAPEKYTLSLDPTSFTPGSTFLLTAQASDFSPSHQHGTSRPIVLRVASLDDLSVPAGDPLEQLVAYLKEAIVKQTRANGLTDNLAVHLSEALTAKDLPQHQSVISSTQNEAHDSGSSALNEANKHDEAKGDVFSLQNIVNEEMPFALGEIGKIAATTPDELPDRLATLQKRQTLILSKLIALLGQIVNDRQKAAQSTPVKTNLAPPSVTSNPELAKLKDDLQAFLDKQKRIIDATKSLKELNPEDLTTEQEKMLGDMAHEEADQAKFFQDTLTDMSRLPLQDFGDGKLVSDTNEVYQEVQAAAQSLYQKRPVIAVPNQQMALENAAKIEQNLEKWLQNSVDNTKWEMEQSQPQADVATAELPKELDDVIGDLMQKEEDLDPADEPQDASNPAMDSPDKGAGWAAADGPISSMSAKGVTGNQLPKNDEISGRSGEGRNGRSDGQMVGDTAVGKGGNETPTRLTATPFEAGSVNDTSKDTKGGATGGGKLSGAGQDGLRGPLPPPTLQRLAYVADQQSKLRQQAESLALQLRKQRRPTGDLESAINMMKQMQQAAQDHNGLGVLQCYQEALSALSAARANYSGDRVSRVETNALQPNSNSNLSETETENAPAGYEEMTGAYFRSLSEAPAADTSTTTPPSK